MTGATTLSRLSRLGLAVLTLTLVMFAAGCGGDAEGDSPVAELEGTSAEEKFRVVSTQDGQQLVAGHGIAFAVPEGWQPGYEEAQDGPNWAWEMQAPSGEPFPPFFNLTVGQEPEGEGRVEELLTVAKGVADVSEEGFELIESGETDVPGAEQARSLTFNRTMTLAADDNEYPVEQHMLFFQLPDDRVVTMRFIAGADSYDESALGEIRDSLAVKLA